MQRKNVFISYSHNDRDFVEQLANDLKEKGFKVWWDEWEIRAGQSITKKVNEGINQSSFLIIVLSPHSVQSDWVKRELNKALKKRLADNDIELVPLLISDIQKLDIPYAIRDLRWADFRQEYLMGFTELLFALDSNSPDRKQKILKYLRDPLWQSIAVFVPIIIFIYTLISSK